MYRPKRHFNYPHPPPPPPRTLPPPPKNLMNIDYSSSVFWIPQVKNRIHMPNSKIHQPRLSDTTCFASWKLLFIIRSKGKKGTCSDQKNAGWVSKSVSQQIKFFWAKWVNIFLSLKQGGNITRLINGGILNGLVTACHILEKILCKILFL